MGCTTVGPGGRSWVERGRNRRKQLGGLAWGRAGLPGAWGLTASLGRRNRGG
jgi:hypothetical protein